MTGLPVGPRVLESGDGDPDDGEPFEAKMRRLVAELQAQQAEGARLDAAIAENLKALGFLSREESR